MDVLDLRLLALLDEDPRAPVAELAESLSVSRNTVHAHLKRLRGQGLLGSDRIQRIAETLGFGVTGFVSIEVAQGRFDVVVDALVRIPQILEAKVTTGRGDIVCRVVVRDPSDLYAIFRSILAIDGVLHTETSVVVAEAIPMNIGRLIDSRTPRPRAGAAQGASQRAHTGRPLS